MDTHLNILILEDSREDVDLIERELNKGGIRFTSVVVNKKSDFESALDEFKPDVILSDHSLPQFNSIEALKLLQAFQQKKSITIPFILITGTVSEEFAVQSIKAGADDYILKDRLKRLPTSIQSALEKSGIENERIRFLSAVMANEALMKESEHLAHFGSWRADLETGKYHWSDETFRIFGYTPGEIEPGYDFFVSHVHPEDLPGVKRLMEDARAHLDAYETEFRIIDKNGNIKHLVSKVGIKRDKERKAIALTGFNLDNTERRKADKEKITILESIGDAFFAVDKSGTVTYWNNIAEIKLQTPKENILGKNIWDVFKDARLLKFYSVFHQAMDEQVAVHFQEYYPAYNMWIEGSAYPTPGGLSVYFRDVTALRKHMEEIEEQNKKLREIAWMQSHEVRAPLARIMGLIQLINGYPEQKMDLPIALNHILTSAKELDEIIRKIVRKTEEIV